jgi:hypothetical protein
LLLLAPFVAVPQWSRTAINGEQTCVRESGERFDVPADSRSWVTFGCNVLNAVETYLGVSLPKAFAQARIDPTTGDGINAENGSPLPPYWLSDLITLPIQFIEGTGGTYDFTPFCGSPQGSTTTVTTDTALPSGVSLPSGVLTVTAGAADATTEIELECNDALTSTVLLVPLEITVTTVEHREMGMGVEPINVTINESLTYEIVYGRGDTLFPDFFDEQWTADFDVSGCGMTPIDTTLTLEAYGGSGSTLGTGYDYYEIDPPDVAMDCTITATMSNFVNDTSAMDTVVGMSGHTTATINVVANDAPSGNVYFSNTAGLTPPTLSSPLTITTKAGLDAYDLTGPAFGGTGAGLVYQVTGGGGDVLIDLSGQSAANVITIPLKVSNCNDVVIRGITMNQVAQAGNMPGDLPGDTNGTNSNPRMPSGGNAFLTDCTGDIWYEGIYAEYNGLEGDNIVYRGSNSQPSQNQNTNVYIVNSRFRGREGSCVGEHSDFYQNQGANSDPDVPNSLWVENVTDFHGHAGVANHNWGGYRTNFTLKNYQSWKNAEYHIGGCNDGHVTLGSNAANLMSQITIIDSWAYDTSAASPWWPAVGYQSSPTPNYFGAYNYAPVPVASRLSELTWGTPGTDMAPATEVGLSYVSPWCDANPAASYCP